MYIYITQEVYGNIRSKAYSEDRPDKPTTQIGNRKHRLPSWDHGTASETKPARHGDPKNHDRLTAFPKRLGISKGNFGTCSKKQIYNSSVLPAIICDAETYVYLPARLGKEHATTRTNEDGK